MPEVICPVCKEDRAHRSHRGGLKDWVAGMFGRRPYRCHSCQHRFLAFRDGEGSSDLRGQAERDIMRLRRRIRWNRLKREILIYGFGCLAFLAVLYYLVQQRFSRE